LQQKTNYIFILVMTLVGSFFQFFWMGNTRHNTKRPMKHMWDHSIVRPTRWRIHEQVGENELKYISFLYFFWLRKK
jgi:hypothetical protein